ncbi:MAG: hypothetical protein GY929_07480 [Actinomycetia bacterium]|nr:hypothetical protein [Actinomycetes bacterium]
MTYSSRRVAKGLRDDLLPGEQVELTIICESKDMAAAGTVPEPPIAPVPTRPKRQPLTDDAREKGMAGQFPEAAAVILTDRRFLVAPVEGGELDEPVLDLRTDEVAINLVSRRRKRQEVELVFTDGSAVLVDAKGGRTLERLINALGGRT